MNLKWYDITSYQSWRCFTCLTVVRCVDQLRYEVAGDGDEEGVGDDGDPGEAHHDVVPDSDIVHYWKGSKIPPQ